MNIKVYNLDGKENGSLELSDAIFNVKIKPEVVHQVFVSQMNNQREPWADVKGKGEVRGGGKKPWKQKGTGRARHGSSRSPIWKGGGVTFGPRSDRNYHTKINKKMRRVALKMCLSDKAQNQALWVVDNFNFTEPKTKLFASLIKGLGTKQKSFLVLADNGDKKLVKIARNIPKITVEPARNANVMDLVNKQAVIVSKAGIGEIEKILTKKEE